MSKKKKTKKTRTVSIIGVPEGVSDLYRFVCEYAAGTIHHPDKSATDLRREFFIRMVHQVTDEVLSKEMADHFRERFHVPERDKS